MKRSMFIGPLLLITIWALITYLGFIDSFFLPSPYVTFKKLFELIISGIILPDLIATLLRVSLAFIIAVILGLPLGLWLGKNESLYRNIEFIIDFFRSMPATALFPLFLLIFGITDASKIALTSFAAMLIIVFNTSYGIFHAKKTRIIATKLMGASDRQIFRFVIFWESLPQTFVGLRSAISLCLVMMIVTEMFIGTPIGLGRKIIDSQITYEVPTMYATIILTGIIGYLLNFFLLRFEAKTLHWNGK